MKSVSGKCFKFRNLFRFHRKLFSPPDNSLCKRMFTLCFQRNCQGKQFIFCDISCRNYIGNLRFPFGDRSCLVQCNNFYLSCIFKNCSSLK